MFFQKKSKIKKALVDLNLNNKCQINILNNDVVVSQAFKASDFSTDYQFSDTYDIAILSKKIPPSYLQNELELLYFETDYNRVIIFCKQKKIDVEQLILRMIKEDMNLKTETLSLDIQLVCY